jgi:hypothetical protein
MKILFAVTTLLSTTLSFSTMADTYEPLPWNLCETIHDDVAQAFDLTFELYEGDFSDYNTDESGQGCIMKATTSGDAFDDASAAMDMLKETLVGWSENEQYLAANDTDNAATAVERDSALILLSITKTVPFDADCPEGPIEACNLSDEELIYEIELKAAMK